METTSTTAEHSSDTSPNISNRPAAAPRITDAIDTPLWTVDVAPDTVAARPEAANPQIDTGDSFNGSRGACTLGHGTFHTGENT
ncbi:hypothetical protein Val02_12930 [Virgisporangium aliadipatigenens]|uniref:Uncharacterized protein n=1 Tax=Virgisporangium aliadipatigenens TaxID=741659 RepID=A0A8J3YHK0_9ACTN|nr:hypothetical protein Val02_12930 [Virgisporangium aliadipatigenens]